LKQNFKTTVTTMSILSASLAFLLSSSLAAPVEAAKCWKQLPPIAGGPRQEHSAAAIGTDLYIVGGLRNYAPSRAVEKFDTVTNKWSEIPALPIPLHHPNVASVGGKLLVLGGLSGTIAGKSMWQAVPNSYAFDPATRKWDKLADMPDERGSAAVGVSGSKVYLAGGLTSGAKSTTAVSMYDAAADKWTSMSETSLPATRDHGGGAIVGDTFYVVGGRDGSVNGFRKETLSLAIGSEGAKWANITNIPTGRGGVSVAVLNKTIYVFGGEGNPVENTRGVFPDDESFDTTSKTWTKETPMRNPRHGTAAVGIGEWIYIAGGGAAISGGSPVATTDAYGPGPC